MGWLFGHKHKYHALKAVQRDNHTYIFYGCLTCSHIKMERRSGQWTLEQIKCANHFYIPISCVYNRFMDETTVEYVCSKCEHQVKKIETMSWTLEQIKKRNRQRLTDQQITEMGG